MDAKHEGIRALMLIARLLKMKDDAPREGTCRRCGEFKTGGASGVGGSGYTGVAPVYLSLDAYPFAVAREDAAEVSVMLCCACGGQLLRLMEVVDGEALDGGAASEAASALLAQLGMVVRENPRDPFDGGR